MQLSTHKGACGEDDRNVKGLTPTIKKNARRGGERVRGVNSCGAEIRTRSKRD